MEGFHSIGALFGFSSFPKQRYREDELRLLVLSIEPFQTPHESQLWALGGKPSKRLVLCPMRVQLVDAIVKALYPYEVKSKALHEIALKWYQEDNAVLSRLVRRLTIPYLLRTQGKLPESSPLKGLHGNTLRCHAKQLLEIARAVSLDDYKDALSGIVFDSERELKNELFCALQAAFTSYGPHNYPKIAANEAIASLLVCFGVEHQAYGQAISDVAEQLRQRKNRRQS